MSESEKVKTVKPTAEEENWAEDAAEGNPTKGEKPNKKKDGKGDKKRKRDDSWKKDIVVTLETPVPEKVPEPTKPDWKKLVAEKEKIRAEMKTITEKIDKLHEDRKVWNAEQREIRAKQREQQTATNQGVEVLFKDQKDLTNEINDIRKEMEVWDKPIKQLDNQMKVIASSIPGGERKARSIQKELEDIEYTLENSQLNGTEERALLKELKVLQKALPEAEKYVKLKDKRKKLLDERAPTNKRLRAKLDQRKKLSAAIDAAKKKRDEEIAEREANGEFVTNAEGKREYVRPKDPITIKIDAEKDKRTKKYEKLKELDAKYDATKKKHDEWWKQDRVRDYIEYRLKRLRDDLEYKEKKSSEFKKRLTDEVNREIEDASFVENQAEIDELKAAITHLSALRPADVQTFNGEIEIATEETFDVENADLGADFSGFKVSGGKMDKDAYTSRALIGGKKKKNKKRNKKGRREAPAKVEEAPAKPEEEEEVPIPERDVFVTKRHAAVLARYEIAVPKKVKELDAAVTAVTAKHDEIYSRDAGKRDSAIAALKQKIADFDAMDFETLKKLDHERYNRMKENRGKRPRRQDRPQRREYSDEEESEEEVVVAAKPEKKRLVDPSKVNFEDQNMFPEM